MALAALFGGCSFAPDIPPDFALPVRDILAQTACELQASFIYLDSYGEFAKFNPKQWLVTINIAPKVDTDLNGGLGGTRVSPYIGKPIRYTTWNISGPGLQLDGKGERSSAINFTFTSSKLMADSSLQCPPSPSIHALHKSRRRVFLSEPRQLDHRGLANIDKPVYNTDITVKFSANGTYTYTFLPGTDVASLGGSYTLDEKPTSAWRLYPISKRSRLHHCRLDNDTMPQSVRQFKFNLHRIVWTCLE